MPIIRSSDRPIIYSSTAVPAGPSLRPSRHPFRTFDLGGLGETSKQRSKIFADASDDAGAPRSQQKGTLLVDGYPGYRKPAEHGDVQVAFCWAQVRRNF
jgi:hypothetical protein